MNDPLTTILRKYNFQKKSQPPQTSVNEIETFLKFSLPEDYKAYILHYNGFEGSIGNAYFYLWEMDKLIEMNRGYEIQEYLPDTFLIGGDGGNEFIAIQQIPNDAFRIVLSPYIDLEKENHIEIGHSFTDFLVRMDEGKEWFFEY